MFKIKDGYKLELQTPETIKLFGKQNKKIKKMCQVFDEFEVLLIQCHLVDNRYQQKSELLHFFMLNKSYAYLVFLKTYNTEFDGIIIAFTYQNGRLLEIEDKLI